MQFERIMNNNKRFYNVHLHVIDNILFSSHPDTHNGAAKCKFNHQLFLHIIPDIN